MRKFVLELRNRSEQIQFCDERSQVITPASTREARIEANLARALAWYGVGRSSSDAPDARRPTSSLVNVHSLSVEDHLLEGEERGSRV